MLDDVNAQSQESLPEEQNSAPKKLSNEEIASAAKARLKAWEMAVIAVLVVPGILALFAVWPIGLVLIGVGVYFRHLAIEDHKNAIFFEMGLYRQKARVARPLTPIRKLLFWMSVVWFALGVLFLVFSIYPGMPAEKIIWSLIGSAILVFAPAYFVCRKSVPEFSLSLLVSAKKRSEFFLHDQNEQELAKKQRKEKTERDMVDAEQRRIEAVRKAKLREEERERKLVRTAEEQAMQDAANRRQAAYLASIRNKCSHAPVVATVLGGSGMPLAVGEVVWVSCRTDTVAFSRIARQEDFTIPYSILVNAEVTGPGTERSNAGVIGGGFGLEGAAKGILIATAINALTGTKKTNTFFNLSTNSGEVRLHVTTLEPEQLRLTLSPVFVRIEAQKHVRVTPNSLSSEIEKLSFLRSSGELTDEEFASAKKKLLVG